MDGKIAAISSPRAGTVFFTDIKRAQNRESPYGFEWVPQASGVACHPPFPAL